MSNLGKACTLASEWVGLMGGLDNISYLYGDDVSGLIHAIHDAGLLMPDLPKPHEVEFPGFATFNLPGAGCSIPLDDYAPQVMVIFGDEECSDATTDAGDRLTAIKPEDLDKLIACLLAAREAMEIDNDF